MTEQNKETKVVNNSTTDKKTIDIAVVASYTISRPYTITTTNYTVDVDFDDEGTPFESVNLENCCIKEEFNEQYYGPIKLLKEFKKMLKKTFN